MDRNRWNLRVFAPLLIAAAAGCGATTTTLTSNETVPVAEGKVRAWKTDNGNTRIMLTVKHLAQPEKVAPDAFNYVVWASPEENPAQPPINVGALRIDKDGKDGHLVTTTPLRRFRLTVTAEPSATTMQPTGPIVLSGRVDKD